MSILLSAQAPLDLLRFGKQIEEVGWPLRTFSRQKGGRALLPAREKCMKNKCWSDVLHLFHTQYTRKMC